MASIIYRCVACDSRFDGGLRYDCPTCGGVLDVPLDGTPRESTFDGPVTSMWKYRDLLPDVDPISLGEGGTPLLTATALCETFDLPVDLRLKTEGVNPTCSFKDRPSAFGLAHVTTTTDVSTGIISSHGNAGASFAAYANRAGIDPVVLVPDGSTAGLPKVQSFQPTTVPVAGTISDTYTLARAAAERFGWYNGTTTHQVPVANLGNRTVAYELYDQLGAAPDWIVVPISAGPLLTQTYRGFQQLADAGLVDDLPSMAGVQASGCAPIAEAYRAGVETVDEWDGRMDTVATSIEDPLRGYSKDGTYTLRVVRDSGGVVLAVDDDAIETAATGLATTEGILAETACATAVVAVNRLVTDGTIGPDETVVGLVTGHGMNEATKLAATAGETERIDPDVAELRRVVDAVGASVDETAPPASRDP
jgi:threonine synthase